MDVQIWIKMYLIAYLHLSASALREKVLFSNSLSIMELDVDTRNVLELVHHGTNEVDALDYDYGNKYVYFPRLGRNDIMRFKYPSAKRTLERVINASNPVGIAVDSVNDHVYWISYNRDNKLSRSNLDGTNVVVVSTPLQDTFAIRLDLTSRWLYMVDRKSGISKSRYDLTGQQTIVNFIAQQVDCIDIDVDENKLYWINNNGNIKSAKDDGSDIQTIISKNTPGLYYAIIVYGSVIYYANESQLLLISKTHGSPPTVLYKGTSRIGSIFVLKKIGM